MTRHTLTSLLLAALLAALPRLHAADPTYKRTLETYTMPDVVLVNQDGVKVPFRQFMESDRLVVVDFIFGTCTTICPVLSVGYTNLQQKLGPDTQKVRLVSISIDPENDSPRVAKQYMKRYRAKPGWDFLTGKREDIDKVMRAFNAYVPNKMYHYPLTLLRTPKDGQWVRIMGIMSSSEFMAECGKVGLR